MDFTNWLTITQGEEAHLKDFIDKLKPFFTDSGFNAVQFERRVETGLTQRETSIDEELKPKDDGQDQ